MTEFALRTLNRTMPIKSKTSFALRVRFAHMKSKNKFLREERIKIRIVENFNKWLNYEHYYKTYHNARLCLALHEIARNFSSWRQGRLLMRTLSALNFIKMLLHFYDSTHPYSDTLIVN